MTPIALDFPPHMVRSRKCICYAMFMLEMHRILLGNEVMQEGKKHQPLCNSVS